MKCIRKKLHSTYKRGQTALEYALVMMAIIVPLAAAITSILGDSQDGKKDNATRQIVNVSYGDEKRMGTIGRPYP